MGDSHPRSFPAAFFQLFLGGSPLWYKRVILSLLALNPLILLTLGPYAAGWILLAEFIFVLAMALKCHPLLPGGLLALEMLVERMVSPEAVYAESLHNFEVILLLVFMVAGVYFMRPFLIWLFNKVLLSTRRKVLLSLQFLVAGAFLSAWLDALTVMAVMIAVGLSFYEIFVGVTREMQVPDVSDPGEREQIFQGDLREFGGFLRNLLMHGAVGTAIGGVATLVGEPQNLLIGETMGWHFRDFYLRMAHVSIPVQLAGVATCLLAETLPLRIFGFGHVLPERVRNVMASHARRSAAEMQPSQRAGLCIMALGGLFLIFCLAFHLASVGLVGLAVIVLLTSLLGKTHEDQIGKAFQDALPFTALIIVFFAFVAMIGAQDLFGGVFRHVMALDGVRQIRGIFLSSALLSSISDNVFVASIFMEEAKKAFAGGLMAPDQYARMAVAINAGTNIPSIATPNGQAAFLFLLTNALAGKIHLSYWEMVKQAVPYTVVLTGLAYFLV